MPVKALKEYRGEVKDRLENFHGNQLVYFGWDRHLMFCAPFCLPLPASMKFGDVVEKVFPGVFGQHPDFAKIDWKADGDHAVQWMKAGQSWKPDFTASLEANGIGHKTAIRFLTPGLDGIGGSCS